MDSSRFSLLFHPIPLRAVAGLLFSRIRLSNLRRDARSKLCAPSEGADSVHVASALVCQSSAVALAAAAAATVAAGNARGSASSLAGVDVRPSPPVLLLRFAAGLFSFRRCQHRSVSIETAVHEVTGKLSALERSRLYCVCNSSFVWRRHERFELTIHWFIYTH